MSWSTLDDMVCPYYPKLIPFFLCSYVDRSKASYPTRYLFLCCTDPSSQDTLKISGMQVSPIEIEHTLLAQPDKLITDVTVAGVTGGRTSDERIPRAWVVLSPAGVALGEKEVVARLNAWVQEQLSRYKWLRGGIGIVDAVGVFLCYEWVC